LTIDEELSKLEDDIRRLKIECEVYYNGSTDRPPRDSVYRIETLIKRLTSDLGKLTIGQRFKLNALAQKYAVQNALWKKRLFEKEAGRGQFAQQRRELAALTSQKTLRVVCTDPAAEPEKADQILAALLAAHQRLGQTVTNVGPVRFQEYLTAKIKEVKATLGCDSVRFSVSAEHGRVKFVAARG
jgi:hypothetical protein